MRQLAPLEAPLAIQRRLLEHFHNVEHGKATGTSSNISMQICILLFMKSSCS